VRLLACVLTILPALARADPEFRLSLAPELEVGGGFDDNLFLNPELVGNTGPQYGDGILHVAPRVAAAVRAYGYQLSLSYDLILHEPLSFKYGIIADQLATLDLRSAVLDTPLVPVVLELSGVVERYDATFTNFPIDGDAITNFDAFGLVGVEAGTALVGSAGRLQAGYRFAVRRYVNRPQQDEEQRVSVSYGRRPLPNLELAASYAYTHLASEQNGTPDFLDDLARHRFAIVARWGSLDGSVRIEPSLALQSVPGIMPSMPALPPGRNDRLVGLLAAASLRMGSAFDLFARYDLLWSRSDDVNPTGDFTRNQVVVGLAVHAFWTNERAPAPETAPDPEPGASTQRLPDGRIRFELRAPYARSVAVVGDWNGWDGSTAALTASGDLWSAALPVPPGRHVYSFLVDGVSVRPPHAESYVSDDFGSENGTFTVPE